MTTEVRTVGNALREIKAGEHPALQTEMVQLREALTVLNVSIDRFESARSILTDEAIGQLGRTVNDALTKLRDCSSNARQMALIAPSETRRSKPGKSRTLKKLTNRRDDVQGEVFRVTSYPAALPFETCRDGNERWQRVAKLFAANWLECCHYVTLTLNLGALRWLN